MTNWGYKPRRTGNLFGNLGRALDRMKARARPATSFIKPAKKAKKGGRVRKRR